MPTYFTVKSPTAADKAAASSFDSGIDQSGTEYMFAKILDADPIPVWQGTAIEVDEVEAPAASQSALYNPQAGPAYRAVCIQFGSGLVSEFVTTTTSALPANVLAPLLEYLLAALAAAQGGYITTLREILNTKPALPPAFSDAVKAELVAQCDLFLDKFPGNAGTF